MRIRKNAKLSSLLFTQAGPPSEVPPAYMCQLNQSPWDVIPFTSSLPDLQLAREEDISFSGSGSWVNDPYRADSGMGAMMVVDDIQIPKRQGSSFYCDDNDSDNDDNDNEGRSDVSKVRSLAVNVGGCRKSNGKGWHCTRAPREGHYLCNHHFKSQKAQNTKNSSSAANKGGSAAGEVPGPRRRGRPPKNAAAANQSAAENNSNKFYYYSGFGPLWGKQHRNDKGATAEGWESLVEESSAADSSYSLQIDGDDVEDEDELSGDSSSSGGGRRKRTRKPVKARSLKSLM